MPQIRLHCRAPRSEAERLFRIAETAFDDDGYPVAIIEVDEAADIHELSIYAEADEVDGVVRRFTALVPDAPVLEREILPDTDWVLRALEGLSPVAAGRFLVHGAHDRAAPARGRIRIEIDAGLAFGTGHHGTTAGCLDMLTSLVAARKPRRVLDLGTGSGVLAIGVAKLARVPVLATDIDPVATRVARANARLNEVSGLVDCATAPGLSHPVFAARGPFDLIVANILARPLMRLAPLMARIVTPGGTVVLSGILAAQRRQVIAAYAAQRFRHLRTLEREGWVTLLLKR